MKQNDIHTNDSVLSEIRISRIIPPILIGVLVVMYLMYRQLDMDELRSIDWGSHTVLWILGAGLMYVVRHMAYSWRLRTLTDDTFSWRKSMEMIVLWEFASAVSPSTVGGAGVALFLLAQEKLSTAKTVSVVLYAMVVDTMFFIISVPILYAIFGGEMIREQNGGVYDIAFWGVLGFMLVYGSVFFYGLFINPKPIKVLLLFFSRIKILKRFKENIIQTAEDVVVTAREMRKQTFRFHTKVVLATLIAWVVRFLAINCIIIALVPSISLDSYTQLLMYARGEAMHIITSFTPTPGGAGFAEVLFGGFYSEWISKGMGTLAALVWRIITYYSYLIVGAIIIPVWISEVMIRRRKKRSENH